MAAKKNGRDRGSQPAKPSRRVTEKVESVVAADRGMTIREEFAKAAMQGLLASESEGYSYRNDEALVTRAVGLADALLAELAKNGAP